MVDDFKGRGGSPWGSPPGGGNGSGRGPTPPDIDEIIKNIQKTINRFIPGRGAKRKQTYYFRINNFSNNLGSQVVYIECYQMNKVLC